MDNQELSEGIMPQIGIHTEKIDTSKKIITITYEVFSFYLSHFQMNEEQYQTVEIEPGSQYHEIGKPILPVKTVFIDIPQNSTFTAEGRGAETGVIQRNLSFSRTTPFTGKRIR